MHSFGPLRHLDLWSVAAFETNGGGGDSRSSSSGGGSPRGSTMAAPKNTAFQNIKMDLGLEPKNDVYYRDITARGIASKAVMESAMSNKSDDGPGLSSAASGSAGAGGGSGAGSPTDTTDVDAAIESVNQIVGGDAPLDAETEALADKGRSSTILTKPSGLLSKDDEDEKTRNRRSLIGS